MAGIIEQDFIEELRQRLDIVNVVGGYVALKQKGRRFWGLCPFHGEKTPSFSVDQTGQMYYCFGCHKGGNVFSFVMERENLDFPETVETLARSVGMEVRYSSKRDNGARTKRERAIACATEAARYFNSLLYADEGKKALDYLHDRGIGDNIVRRFGLGYGGSGGLIGRLEQAGFTREEMLSCAVIAVNEGRTYEAFRGRAIFPIMDVRGQVIGFGGRALEQGRGPKYLNSSDTVIFNKRQNLYALNFARKSAKGIVYLVEGYIDVVTLSVAGISNCVATLGTAITPEQARLLKRYADRCVIAYDGDSAGQEATRRAIGVLEGAQMSARVVKIPGGMDPDDYVKKNGPEAFLQLHAMSGTSFLLEMIKAEFDMSGDEERMRYAVSAAQIIGKLTSPVERELYIKQVERETGFSRESVAQQVAEAMGEEQKKEVANIERPAIRRRETGGDDKSDYYKAQCAIISLIACGHGKIVENAVSEDMFLNQNLREIYLMLKERTDEPLLASRVLGEIDDEKLRQVAASAMQQSQDIDRDKLPEYAADALTIINIKLLESRQREIEEKSGNLVGDDLQDALLALKDIIEQLSALKSGKRGDSYV